MIVREDGVLLTSLSLVRNTGRVMIRLSNGETYDQVDLIGYDERPGLAALRIAATGLPVASIETGETLSQGGPAWVAPHPGSLEWKAIRGTAGPLRLADEIPGAGMGYRAWPVTAASPPGSSGAPLVDATEGDTAFTIAPAPPSVP